MFSGGYSLIELLVAIGVFSTVVAVLSGAFIISLNGQKKTVSVQNVADDVRYATEIMAKEIRMMDVDPSRQATADNNGGACSGNCRMLFYSNMPHRNPNAQVAFYLDPASHTIMFDDDTSDALAAEPITSSGVTVNALAFDVSGIPPSSQPRVTFVVRLASNDSNVAVRTTMNVQTTISPRTL
ncbi:prepilin-type N-terminal cleavage/methylation domain-containing protein [Candidatus Azambacteria bacterium]|nr:prepilin-type N-terminal cleavage/methylation domain-containing protein [Candidatus Azambacteria bacterium]